MAKSTKKTEAPAKPAAPKKAPAKKPAAQGAAPMVDTNLAAQNAARMLVSKQSGDSVATQPHATESSAFKHMKEQIAKPKPAGLAHLLGTTGEKKKTGPQFGFNQQKGHAQTFGGLNKAGVPRRTNG